MRKLERCCKCDSATGKAGAGDDSLYTESDGPFCEDCFAALAAPSAASDAPGLPPLPKASVTTDTHIDGKGHPAFTADQMQAYARAAIAASLPKQALTEEQISKAARYLSDFSSDQCSVDKDDAWKIYGNDEIEVLRAALASAGVSP